MPHRPLLHSYHRFSLKFFRKIVYINTLSALAHHVPFTQVDISPQFSIPCSSVEHAIQGVFKGELEVRETDQYSRPIRVSVFGVPLEELTGFDGEKGSIPRVVKDAIHYVRDSDALLLDAFTLCAETF